MKAVFSTENLANRFYSGFRAVVTGKHKFNFQNVNRLPEYTNCDGVEGCAKANCHMRCNNRLSVISGECGVIRYTPLTMSTN